jgi:sensor histidine kinase YesM
MISQKTKSIFLICFGYLVWILLDTIFWMYNNPDKYALVLEHNLTRFVYGVVACILFALIQWKIIEIYSSRRFLTTFTISTTTLAFSFILACFNNITFNFWSAGIFKLQVSGFFWTTFFNCLVLFLGLMGLFYVLYFRNLSTVQKEQIAQAKALADEAQLMMLRYQINPHFLFNSLNAIQSMIEKDKVRAKEMIADLSDFFRYTLSKNNQTLVPLQEEIDALHKYLAIQKERFSGRLKIDYEIDDASLKVMLPFFIIHPLVENAIKYGYSAENDTLQLLIKVTRKNHTLTILVKNSGVIAPSAKNNGEEIVGTKTGIDNIRKRLSLFYPDCSTFELFEKDRWVHALITITHPSISV